MSKAFIVSVVLTIIYTTFILTNIYAQEDMLMSDLFWAMSPAWIPWGIYFAWKAIKKTPSTKSASKSQLADEVRELKKLYKEGTLSKQEFTKAKNKLIK
jgi:uncharacterized membrane protein